MPYRLRYCLCAAAALLPLWTVKYLPMVDLPQHAAQIAMWKHWRDPAFGFHDQVAFNWFTPYLLGYCLARAAATLLPIATALKGVVTVAVLALPLSIRFLLRRTQLDPSWSLLGFPLAFGFNFQWGLFNYVLAIPLGIAFVAVAVTYAEAPTRRNAVTLLLLGLALFLGHALILGMGCLAAAATIALAAPDARRAVQRCWPLVPPLLLAAVWAVHAQTVDTPDSDAPWWMLSPWRLPQLFSDWLGTPLDLAAGAGGLALALILLAGGLGWERRPARYAPLGVALALYLLGPHRAQDIFLIHERFAVFVLPFALLALRPVRLQRQARARELLVAAVLVWMVFLTGRHRIFDHEARELDPLLAAMEPNRRVLPLTFDLQSAAGVGYPFLHHVAWYQVERGGVLAFSFATFFPELLRYRPGKTPPATHGIERFPERFRWEVDGLGFDYFVVRSERDRGPSLFAHATQPVVLEARSGRYWLYHRRPAPAYLGQTPASATQPMGMQALASPPGSP